MQYVQQMWREREQPQMWISMRQVYNRNKTWGMNLFFGTICGAFAGPFFRIGAFSSTGPLEKFQKCRVFSSCPSVSSRDEKYRFAILFVYSRHRRALTSEVGSRNVLTIVFHSLAFQKFSLLTNSNFGIGQRQVYRRVRGQCWTMCG